MVSFVSLYLESLALLPLWCFVSFRAERTRDTKLDLVSGKDRLQGEEDLEVLISGKDRPRGEEDLISGKDRLQREEVLVMTILWTKVKVPLLRTVGRFLRQQESWALL